MEAPETAGQDVLVLGGTGATGQRLVRLLLERGVGVRVTVRSAQRLPEDVREHPRLAVTEASLLDLGGADLARHVNGVRGVASCLGHTLSFAGIYLPPRRLVSEAVRRICQALAEREAQPPGRFVLMNTTGVRNHDLRESVSLAQRAVLGILRVAVPPHADNEQAAEVLRVEIGPGHPCVQWVAVRPDGLHELEQVTPYTLHPSPTRSAIFDAGKTSRLNVAHFMAELLTDDATWARWQGRMPVIYDAPD
mgnify:CR=1 FL=1